MVVEEKEGDSPLKRYLYVARRLALGTIMMGEPGLGVKASFSSGVASPAVDRRALIRRPTI
jgi:hypothetical protein